MNEFSYRKKFEICSSGFDGFRRESRTCSTRIRNKSQTKRRISYQSNHRGQRIICSSSKTSSILFHRHFCCTLHGKWANYSTMRVWLYPLDKHCMCNCFWYDCLSCTNGLHLATNISENLFIDYRYCDRCAHQFDLFSSSLAILLFCRSKIDGFR